MSIHPIKSVSISRTSRGFTIVETLVAITILMIAVAGPLVIASKALTAALYARDQAAAAFLAQESMEVIKNMRDNNIVRNGVSNWLIGTNSGTTLNSCVGNTCDAGALDSSLSLNCNTDGCRLYFDPTSDGFKHSGTIASKFSRYFTLVQARSTDDYIATVYVKWYEGTVSNQVKVSSELTAAIR